MLNTLKNSVGRKCVIILLGNVAVSHNFVYASTMEQFMCCVKDYRQYFAIGCCKFVLCFLKKCCFT